MSSFCFSEETLRVWAEEFNRAMNRLREDLYGDSAYPVATDGSGLQAEEDKSTE